VGAAEVPNSAAPTVFSAERDDAGSRRGGSELDYIIRGIVEAFRLLFGGDATTYEIALRSLRVAGSALAISLVLGVPLGMVVALNQFPLRRLVVASVNTGMGVPPVVVGLVVALFLWRSGPFGSLHLMYTVTGMVIAQVLIALPIIAGLSLAALQQLDAGFRLQILSLGAGRFRLFLLLLREIRVPLMAAVMAAFGGIISEVGAVMLVGGNIEGRTRVLTTAIVLETRQGNFELALALGAILLAITFIINVVMLRLQGKTMDE